MTVDIGLMMGRRDEQCAEEVARMAALGWFDVEFTVYGFGFLEGGERKYTVSSDAGKIYDLMEQREWEGNPVTTIQQLTRRYSVPIGMQQFISTEVKKELAMEMEQDYSTEFFTTLKEVSDVIASGAGVKLLDTIQNNLIGVFDAEKLDQFEVLVRYLYNAKKIKKEHLKKYSDWLSGERKYMLDNITSKNIYQKTFYGIAYVDGENVQYFNNAVKEHAYRKQRELEEKGCFVTPIYAKTFYYDSSVRPLQIKQFFEGDLKAYFCDSFVKKLNSICRDVSLEKKKYYGSKTREITERFGESVQKTIEEKGRHWGLI